MKWVSTTPSGKFIVKMLCRNGKTEDSLCNPLSWNPDTKFNSILLFVEADETSRGSVLSSPPDGTRFNSIRKAAVLGINIGGDCKSGACKKFSLIDQCTLSYNIETSMEGTRPGGFDFVDADILLIACKCSCGIEFSVYSTSSNTSSRLVSLFLNFLLNHKPLWLIG